MFFQGWMGDVEGALKRAQELQREQPEDDDLRRLTAYFLGRAKRYPEALALLQAIPARGAGQADLLRQLVTVAIAAKEMEIGRKAATRLLALPLPPFERQQLGEQLRALGMEDKAAQLTRTTTRASNPQAQFMQAVQEVENLISQKKPTEAMAAARKVLSADPAVMVTQRYSVENLLRRLNQAQLLDDYLTETERSLAQTPDSVRLNLIMAFASGARERSVESEMVQRSVAVPLPCWLKLERKGAKISASYSMDQKSWRFLGSAQLDGAEPLVGGLALASRDEQAPGNATFEELHVLGENPPTATTLAPWERRDIGTVTEPGRIDFEGSRIRLTGAGRDIGEGNETFGYFFRPLAADASLQVRLTEMPTTRVSPKTGLVVRSGLAPGAAQAGLLFRDGALSFHFSPGASTADRYFRKLIELRPSEWRYQQLYANWLRRGNRQSEALAIYRQMLQGNTASFGEIGSDLVDAFRRAGKMKELGELLLALPERPANQPGYGNTGLDSYILATVVKELETAKEPDLVVRLCRAGRKRDVYNVARQSLGPMLKALVALGRREEAVQEAVAVFGPGLEVEESTAALAANQLGFSNSSRVPQRSIYSWGVSFGDRLQLEALSALEPIREVGLLPEVISALDRTAKVGKPRPEGRAVLAYLRLLEREPAGIEEFRKLMAEGAIGTAKQPSRPASPFGDQLAVLLLEAAHEVKSWPGQEKTSLELQRAAAPAMAGDSFLKYGRRSALLELALTEIECGDPHAADTVRALHEAILKAGAPGGSTGGQSVRTAEGELALTLLIRLGLEKEYGEFLEKFAKTPEGAKLAWTFDEERRNFLGEAPRVQGMLWLDDPLDGVPTDQATVRFELRREHRYDHGDVYKYVSARGRSIVAMEKPRTLKIEYGRSPQDLAEIGAVETTKTAGTWQGRVPLGFGFLRASLKGGEAGATAEASPVAPVLRAPNLIRNATFQGVETRPIRGTFDLVGWKALAPGLWKHASGGPHGSGSIIFETRDRGQEVVLAGEPMPLTAGHDAFQSAWLRPLPIAGAAVEVGRRYLDASGRELRSAYFPSYTAFNWRWHGQVLTTRNEAGADQIPKTATHVVPLIKVRGGAEWAGLYLGTAKPEAPIVALEK
jgi:hypothetical protein